MHRRPEAVTVDGRVQAWLIGSGTEWTAAGSQAAIVQRVLDAGEPVVIDAGALPLAGLGTGISIVTPHHAECARLLGKTREEVDADPMGAATTLADQRSVTVVLKGHTTLVVSPQSAGERFARRLAAPTTWLATAGTGDVLAGIMGALVATHADDLAENPDSAAPIAATAVLLHGLAAVQAGSGGPFGASDISAHLGPVIADILEHRDDSQNL
jgi:NAD(P)H-hydrate repair Nnr-like enzyme with NAD(P)H-hydrate dehydratase domain